ncbi:hypothetical protein GMLC_38750 [Geomonas limicola]|uniref:Divergent polysaccharide deacetylase family protein n=1 Tax=Geomonas limicola TaxID=2740186 RepID=A0A6V8NCN7_9BACT|nr:hypothetical protein GMLC_38750 [Geomonas limicola]
MVIAAAMFLLEHGRSKTAPAPKAEHPAAHLKIPARPEPRQEALSSAHPLKPETKPAKPHQAALPHGSGPGRLAIIIDDMGASPKELQALLSIDLPITFSVIPSLAHAREVAEKAHAAGREVMVHMPMEPEGYPRQPMEKVGVLVAMSDAEIADRVNSYFRSVPHAVGANNHMGSRFTQSAEKMEVVLKVLQGKGVFFVDSMTSPSSAGLRTAKALGIRCAARQVFLDNVQDEALIGKQLAQAAAIARKRGSAIAICHPHPATIRALRAMMPQLAREGITFVHASELTS